MRFSAIIHKEGKWFVSLCPELVVASQGRTEEEAVRNLQEAGSLKCELNSGYDKTKPGSQSFGFGMFFSTTCWCSSSMRSGFHVWILSHKRMKKWVSGLAHHLPAYLGYASPLPRTFFFQPLLPFFPQQHNQGDLESMRSIRFRSFL